MAIAHLDETKAKNVLRQVEFYFSDSNLPRDKFLKKSVEESEDGLVSLALICAFARMRTHLGLGDLKPEEVPEEMVLAVAETLRKSEFLKVSEDGKRIGRSTELSKPEDVQEQVDSRTIAASPLPYDVKIEELESFFGQHGKVNSVRLPRLIGDKKEFCGTALIEFSEEGDAKKVLSTSIIYAGAELEMTPKKDFDAEREKKSKYFEKTRSNKDANGSYPKGLIVAFKLKRIQLEESAEQNGQEAIDGGEVCKTAEVPDSGGNMKDASANETPDNVDDNEGKSAGDAEKGNEGKADEDHSEEANEKASKEGVVKDTKGSSVESGEKISANDEDVVTREDLKAVFQKYGAIKFIDFRMGEEAGYIRFEDADAALKARAVAVLNDVGGFIVKNHIATLEPVTGDAEKEYWSLLRSNQDRYKENRGGNRGRGRGNRGDRSCERKRHRQVDSSHGRSNKAQKVGASK